MIMIELSEQCNGYCRPGCNLAHLRHVWRDPGSPESTCTPHPPPSTYKHLNFETTSTKLLSQQINAGEEHGHLDTYSRICCIKGGHAVLDCVPNYRHCLFFCWHTGKVCGAVRQAKLDCSQCKPGHVLATVAVDCWSFIRNKLELVNTIQEVCFSTHATLLLDPNYKIAKSIFIFR